MSLDTIRVFAISKLDWIKQQQQKLREQERETPREYLDRESHYVWGKRYLLKVVESDRPPSVALNHSHMVLCGSPGSGEEAKAGDRRAVVSGADQGGCASGRCQMGASPRRQGRAVSSSSA